MSCEVTKCSEVPAMILVSSDGNTADFQGDKIGLYELMSVKHNNAPAYRQLHNVTGTQPHYIYKNDN